MSQSKPIDDNIAHKLPKDLRLALLNNDGVVAIWNSLTPLARNEWICWTISVKTQKTRQEHITRVITDLTKGKRRPCCWIGCVHRTDKPVSASQKHILSRNK
ncbi:YdeI/OmpD-associated family protein [Candidatus Saccharibacteria bacterium]|nr:YdeI/OmpD-associated family protein [Candidatus Saccharibacteria bacterium]